MSSCPVVSNDFPKTEAFSSGTTQFHGDTSNSIASSLERENVSFQQSRSQRTNKDMSQAVDLFRKYLLDKDHKMGKAAVQEAEDAVKFHPMSRSLLTSLHRKPSKLEQELFPQAGSMPILNNKSSMAQLTIFYSGAINVYDNVPVDKAQAILLLAGKSSLANAVSQQLQTTKEPTLALPRSSSLPSVAKLQAELPIARKHSLQRFLEKRRDRVINKNPYASPVAKQDISEMEKDVFLTGNRAAFSLAPFPSLLGGFSSNASAHIA